jgi:hypothetical protein
MLFESQVAFYFRKRRTLYSETRVLSKLASSHTCEGKKCILEQAGSVLKNEHRTIDQDRIHRNARHTYRWFLVGCEFDSC